MKIFIERSVDSYVYKFDGEFNLQDLEDKIYRINSIKLKNTDIEHIREVLIKIILALDKYNNGTGTH